MNSNLSEFNNRSTLRGASHTGSPLNNDRYRFYRATRLFKKRHKNDSRKYYREIIRGSNQCRKGIF